MDIQKKLCKEFSLRETQVSNVLKLIDEGNTIPFIVRYRKEMTGSLDDQILRELDERLKYLRNFEERKSDIIEAIAAQDKLTPEIRVQLEAAETLTELEDIYRPYVKKKKTRAGVAREKGLEPLTEILMMQRPHCDIYAEAAKFVNPENGVNTPDEALAGASDIAAENISDDATLRKRLRSELMTTGILTSKAIKKIENSVYDMYSDYSEAIGRIAPHRVLAVDRGEREKVLRVSISADDEKLINIIKGCSVTGRGKASEIVGAACEDSFKRLIFPSLEREIRTFLTENASKSAIKVFSVNLRQLLMQPPVKNKVTLGLDPGYRTGCKVAVTDRTGKVLDTAVIYPTPPHNKIEESKRILRGLIEKHGVMAIAIGNGTASRESESLVASLLKEMGQDGIGYMMVSEAGASVYSASKLAAEEFPQFDVSLRSAVSIARRLQDPLAELVKIDTKSIGVGQYQHDMPPKEMDEALGGVVEDCVNNVGVDLNTASVPLLSRVAGINGAIAKKIVEYREKNGEFCGRKQLLKVEKLGEKTYKQCAGFLRVSGGENILDNTSVHPESYGAACKLLKLCGYTLEDVAKRKIDGLSEKAERAGYEKISAAIGVGVPTLTDIIKELQKPGRDPRDELPPTILRSDIVDIKDLRPGMELKGTVRNVVDFGAFIDIGLHEDGLVHISQICDKFIKHPLEVLNIGDVVTVRVLDVDQTRKRISLTMRKQ